MSEFRNDLTNGGGGGFSTFKRQVKKKSAKTSVVMGFFELKSNNQNRIFHEKLKKSSSIMSTGFREVNFNSIEVHLHVCPSIDTYIFSANLYSYQC